jgi:hypothetical protein
LHMYKGLCLFHQLCCFYKLYMHPVVCLIDVQTHVQWQLSAVVSSCQQPGSASRAIACLCHTRCHTCLSLYMIKSQWAPLMMSHMPCVERLWPGQCVQCCRMPIPGVLWAAPMHMITMIHKFTPGAQHQTPLFPSLTW